MRNTVFFFWAAALVSVPAEAHANETQRTAANKAERTPEVEKARSAFEAVAREVYAEILQGFPAEQKVEMSKALGCDEGDCAEKSAEFLIFSCAAFTPTQREAGAIVAGQFDDEANSAMVKSAAKHLTAMKVPLPFLLTHLIGKVEAKKIQGGIQLEFTARLLAFFTSRATRVMADAKPVK